MDTGAIDRGLEVVAALAPMEPTVADLVDALEMVCPGPDEIRAVLELAEDDGLIEREASTIRRGRSLAPSARRGQIIRRDGEFSCRRCGRRVTTGHFIKVGTTEVGPYGSTCIGRLTGRE